MGITLLNLVTGLNILEFSLGGRIYDLIIAKDFDKFWYEVHVKIKNSRLISKPSDFTPFTSDFKSLIIQMICFKEHDRISISDIKQHPWMQTPFKAHAYRQYLLVMMAKQMKNRRLQCQITKEDYDQILENMKKEDNGEFLKKKILSMMHLVIPHQCNS